MTNVGIQTLGKQKTASHFCYRYVHSPGEQFNLHFQVHLMYVHVGTNYKTTQLSFAFYCVSVCFINATFGK